MTEEIKKKQFIGFIRKEKIGKRKLEFFVFVSSLAARGWSST